MRNALLICLAMAPFATPAADAAPRPAVSVYFAEQKNALAAYQRRDVTAMLAAAQAMLVANPGHPPARYTLAAAQALAGRGDDALAGLEALADLGLVQQPRREPAFASLLDDPRFAQVEARFAANAQPRGKVRVVLAAQGLPGDFIPEAFARDEQGKRTLFASVRQRRIAAVADDGGVSDFVPQSRHGLMSALGVHVVGDELLVASSGMAEMRPADKALVGSAGVFAFARADGEPHGKWLLPPPASGPGHAIGDVLPLANGRLLATDSGRGIVWLLDRGSGHWYQLLGGPELAPTSDAIGSPQGIAALGSDRYAFADYTTGLWIVGEITVRDGAPSPDRAQPARILRERGASATLERLESDVPAALYGIDGLYTHGSHLIATQNGTNPQRLLRLRLNDERDRIVRVEVLASAHPDWDEITLGQVVGDEFRFVANSHWSKFDEQGELPKAETLSTPLIMAVDLR